VKLLHSALWSHGPKKNRLQHLSAKWLHDKSVVRHDIVPEMTKSFNGHFRQWVKGTIEGMSLEAFPKNQSVTAPT